MARSAAQLVQPPQVPAPRVEAPASAAVYGPLQPAGRPNSAVGEGTATDTAASGCGCGFPLSRFSSGRRETGIGPGKPLQPATASLKMSACESDDADRLYGPAPTATGSLHPVRVFDFREGPGARSARLRLHIPRRAPGRSDPSRLTPGMLSWARWELPFASPGGGNTSGPSHGCGLRQSRLARVDPDPCCGFDRVESMFLVVHFQHHVKRYNQHHPHNEFSFPLVTGCSRRNCSAGIRRFRRQRGRAGGREPVTMRRSAQGRMRARARPASLTGPDRK